MDEGRKIVDQEATGNLAYRSELDAVSIRIRQTVMRLDLPMQLGLDLHLISEFAQWYDSGFTLQSSV
jgi:hypothetical protein